ncbi:MAG: tRNA pseudouridine(55) synthase TruB [Rhodothermaceae bacterium]
MKMITTDLNNYSEINFAAGEVILFDKLEGFSSFNVVNRVRRLINVKKVGHAGTLDPLATGLLILCTGKKTKEIYKYQDLPKVYTGIISIGKRTPSMDSETEFTEEKDISGVTSEQIEETRKSFLGEIEQVPPMYSAIKHNGKSLYHYARKGKMITREARKVEIYDFKITEVNLPDIHFEIKCSKGTYIRVIADDFGQKLGCGGYLKKLRRTAIGDYNVENAFTVEQFIEFFEENNKHFI